MCSKSSCGLFGECQDDICVCSKGWSQTLDFAFNEKASVAQDDAQFLLLPCNSHEATVKTLHGFGAFGLISMTLAFLVTIKRFSQFRRIVLFLLGNSLLASVSLRRVISTDRSAVVSGDVFMGIGMMAGLCLQAVYGLIFSNKWKQISKRRLKLNTAASGGQTKCDSILFVVAAVDLFLAFCVSVVPSILLEYENRFRIWQAAMFLCALFFALLAVIFWRMFDQLVSDVKQLQNSSLLGTIKFDVHSTIKNFRLSQKAAAFYFGFGSLAAFVPATSENLIAYALWVFPSLNVISAICSLAMLFLFFKNKKRKSNKESSAVGKHRLDLSSDPLD